MLMILSLAHLLPFAGHLLVWLMVHLGGLYLVIIKEEAEATRNRFERTESSRGLMHPTKDQFGHGRHSRLPT